MAEQIRKVRNMRKILIIFISSITFLIPISGSVDLSSEKLDVGLWDNEDCKKTSDAAGFYLYMSGVLLETADKEEKRGKGNKAKELYEGSLFFSQLAANAAKNFEAFCKE